MDKSTQIEMLDEMWSNFFALRGQGLLLEGTSGMVKAMADAYTALDTYTPGERWEKAQAAKKENKCT
jgi:hypothetical protein